MTYANGLAASQLTDDQLAAIRTEVEAEIRQRLTRPAVPVDGGKCSDCWGSGRVASTLAGGVQYPGGMMMCASCGGTGKRK